MKTRDSQSSDVIIIGGGATGAGIARDCALRGLRVILVERHDIATGATGRNHGLLHSGARYAVTDAESARECISENQILKRIARHCVEPTACLSPCRKMTSPSRPLLSAPAKKQGSTQKPLSRSKRALSNLPLTRH